jgi:hypothetical protein
MFLQWAWPPDVTKGPPRLSTYPTAEEGNRLLMSIDRINPDGNELPEKNEGELAIPRQRKDEPGREPPPRADERSWQAVVSRTLRSWGVTVRAVVLLVVLLTGLAGIACLLNVNAPVLFFSGLPVLRSFRRTDTDKR